MESLKTQPGGDHYRKMKIQPIEYIVANGIDFLAGNIIKYASRHSSKGGAADIRKIKHYCDLILEFVYGESPAGEAPSVSASGGADGGGGGGGTHPQAQALSRVFFDASGRPWMDEINSGGPAQHPSTICQGCGRTGGHHRPECKTQEHNDGRSDG